MSADRVVAVPEPHHLTATRAAYDTVADTYAETVPALFAQGVLGRTMLNAFADLLHADGGDRPRPVADLGCGPGQVTDYLAGLGLPAFGVDLSPRMVANARRRHPALRFEVGTMTALNLADGALGGIVAWWSIIHTPPDELPALFAEFHRALAPEGLLLVGFHVGDERLSPQRAYGHAVSYDTYLLSPDRVDEALAEAGFAVAARMWMEGRKRPQACTLARRAERASG